MQAQEYQILCQDVISTFFQLTLLLMTCFQMLCQKLEIFFLVLYWILFVLQIP